MGGDWGLQLSSRRQSVREGPREQLSVGASLSRERQRRMRATRFLFAGDSLAGTQESNPVWTRTRVPAPRHAPRHKLATCPAPPRQLRAIGRRVRIKHTPPRRRDTGVWPSNVSPGWPVAARRGNRAETRRGSPVLPVGRRGRKPTHGQPRRGRKPRRSRQRGDLLREAKQPHSRLQVRHRGLESPFRERTSGDMVCVCHSEKRSGRQARTLAT